MRNKQLRLFLFSLLIFSCSKTETPEIPLKKHPIKAEVYGCRSFSKDKTCGFLKEDPFKVWVKTPPGAKIKIFLNNKEVDSFLEKRMILAGHFFKFKVTENTSLLKIQSFLPKSRGTWLLKLKAFNNSPSLEKAQKLKKSGKKMEARSLLKSFLSGQINAFERAKALSILARISLGLRKPQKAKKHFRTALKIYQDLGENFLFVNDSTTLAYTYIFFGGELSKAREVLEKAQEKTFFLADAHFFIDYYFGLLSSKSGDLRNAILSLKKARQQASRLKMDDLQGLAEQVLASYYGLLGRTKDSSKLFDQIWQKKSKSLSNCSKGTLLNNRGWTRILRLDSGETGVSDPMPFFLEAQDIFEKKCPDWHQEKINVKINMALTYYFSNQIPKAQKIISNLETGEDPRFYIWLLDLKGRIASKKGYFKRALRLYSQMEKVGQAALSPSASWRASLGQAKALESLKNYDEAEKAYDKSENLLVQSFKKVSIGEGQGGFLSRHLKGSQKFVQFLLKRGKSEKALESIRNYRVRVLQALSRQTSLTQLNSKQRKTWEESIANYQRERAELEAEIKDDWKLSGQKLEQVLQLRQEKIARLAQNLDQSLSQLGQTKELHSKLGKPKKDELFLIYFPLKNYHVGFALSQNSLKHKRINSIDLNGPNQEISEAYLMPFNQEITIHKKIKLILFGQLNNIQFHTLPWQNKALFETKEVLYTLDLEDKSSQIKENKLNSFLLVSDPEENLPLARKEAKMVQELISKETSNKRNWTSKKLFGSQANFENFKTGLLENELFHYAGHAKFGGFDGLDSQFQLSDGASFKVGDILSLNKVPSKVVLLGCETGKTEESQVLSLGLAQAFLLSGSQKVLATHTPLEDKIAPAVAKELYSKNEKSFLDYKSYRNALLQAKKLGKSWKSIRLFVR